jgi:hypothetical protein
MGERSESRPGRALPPVTIVQETGWDPQPVWTEVREKSLTSARVYVKPEANQGPNVIDYLQFNFFLRRGRIKHDAL